MQPMAHKKPVPFTVFENCQKSIIASKIEYEVDFWREMNDFQTLFCSALQMRRAIAHCFCYRSFLGVGDDLYVKFVPNQVSKTSNFGKLQKDSSGTRHFTL